jgi:hypothetical protein
MSFFFNGRLWTSPATVSAVDDSAMFNRGLSVGNVLAIIGRSDSGKPFEIQRFGNPTEAKALGGEALKAVQKAFDPSAQVGGPSEVVFIRVNTATQASLVLNNSVGGAVINLVSTDYGLSTNNIRVKIEAGSVSGKKLTTQLGLNYFAADNVARNAFSIQYVGAGAAATMTLNGTTLTLTVDAATVATIDLNSYKTVQDLVDRLNGVTSFTASVVDGNGGKATLNALDFVTTQNVKTAAFTVTATLQACIDWFNSVAEGFVTATRADNAGLLPLNIPYTYLSGGSDGTVTNTEWQAAFDALQAADVQWVVGLSPLASVHAMVDAHCAYMSNVARLERRSINGTDVGTTDADAIARAKALNSDRASLVHIGFYDYDANGVWTLFPPYILAAQIAGAFAGVNPGTPMTNKSLKVGGLERKLRNPTDTDQLINGGILCVEETNKGFKVVQSISTWLSNDNYNRVEVSCGVALDFVARNVREVLDDLRGAKGTPLALSDAVSRTDSRLRELSKPEPVGPGVLVGDKLNPPYKNITASLEGDVIMVTFECSPVIGINYAAVAIHAVPYSGSASL